MPAIAIRWVADPRAIRSSAPAPSHDSRRLAAAHGVVPPSPERATPWLPDRRPEVYSAAKIRDLLRI